MNCGAMMPLVMSQMMGGLGGFWMLIWSVIGILLIILLVVVIMKLLKQ